MTYLTGLTVASLLVTMALLAPGAAAAAAANVLSNGGFESQEDWTSNSDSFSIVKEGRDGGMVLRFAAAAPGASNPTVRKFSQPISLVPGRLYKASAWMKTADVKGEGTAPTVTIEYFNQGQRVTECYPPWFGEHLVFGGQSGTGDWHELTDSYMHTPLNFDSAVLSCSVGAGITGTAWWDDISLTPLPLPLLQTYVLEPNYRGWMYGPYPSAIRLHLAANYQDHSLDRKNLRFRALLTSSSGKTVLDASRRVEQEETSWSIKKPRKLAAGTYSLQITLVDKDSEAILSESRYSLVQWAGNAPEAKCWIDRHQRLIVDGKPFFPLGMFAGLPSEEDLQRISGSAFNCMMPYFLWGQASSGLIEDQKKYLELSERLGIKTIYSTKDLHSERVINQLEGLHGKKGKEAVLSYLVETFRDDPNIIAWYINDEIGVADVEKVREHYNITRDLDADHPIWMCDYRPSVLRHFWGTSDVYGVDWYPIAWLPVGTVVKESAKARDQVFSARPRWDVPQAHNLQIYNSGAKDARPPTYEEMRNMCYQFLCNGATGLVSFCYDDLKRSPLQEGWTFLTSRKTFEEQWRDVTTVAAEIKAISPILLSVDEPLSIGVEGPESVRSFQKAYQETTHVFLVNTARTAQSARLILPAARLAVRLDGIPQTLAPRARSVPVDLAAIGVCHVEVSDPK